MKKITANEKNCWLQLPDTSKNKHGTSLVWNFQNSSNFVRKVACKLLEEWSGTDYCLVLPWQPLEIREIQIKLIRSWPQLLINCCWGVWVTSGISCSCLLKEKEGPHPPLDEKGHIFTSTWFLGQLENSLALWRASDSQPRRTPTRYYCTQ